MPTAIYGFTSTNWKKCAVAGVDELGLRCLAHFDEGIEKLKVSLDAINFCSPTGFGLLP
jgi:hypothetical protein